MSFGSRNLPSREYIQNTLSSMGAPMMMSQPSNVTSDPDELDSNGYKRSNSDLAFSDFKLGGEKDFIQEKLKTAGKAYYADAEEDETKNDLEGQIRQQALAEMQKIGDIYKFGQFEFELEDAQENLRDKGVDHYTEDMGEDDALEFSMIAERIINGTATDADMKRAGELSPNFVRDSDDAHSNRIVRENEMFQQESSFETERINEKLDDYKPKSIVTQPFNAEASGRGSDEFSLDNDANTQIAKSEFSLDV